MFGCFSAPFEYGEIVDAIRQALNAPEWHDGIEVISGLADWFTIRVSCRRLSAERLVRFMSEC